jgi:hydrogenase maturation protease
MADEPDMIVIGLGNLVMSDDGLGVHAVRRLRDRYRLAGEVDLVEGGTAGLLLLPRLADARRVIILDAIDAGAPAGALVRLEGEEWRRAFAAPMTPHDVGLADLLGAAQLTGAWPERLVLHGAQPESTALGTELSAPVAAAIDALVDRVAGELADWGVSLAPAAEDSLCA